MNFYPKNANIKPKIKKIGANISLLFSINSDIFPKLATGHPKLFMN